MKIACACCAAAAVAAPASASVSVGGSLAAPTLRVDAQGAAEAGWTQGGARQYLVLPATGKVFHGRLPGPDVSTAASAPGLTGASATTAGKQVRIYVYLDCSGCPAGPGWTPLLGVAPRADGSFSVLLRPAWTGHAYRASVEGPNLGATLAPDAQAIVAAPS